MADGLPTSDLGGIAAVGTFLMGLGGYFHMRIKETSAKTEKVAADLAVFKTEVVRDFIPRVQLDQMETRILGRLDKQDDRQAAEIGALRALIESHLFRRANDQVGPAE